MCESIKQYLEHEEYCTRLETRISILQDAFHKAVSNWVKNAYIEPPYSTANDDAIIEYQKLKILEEVEDENM